MLLNMTIAQMSEEVTPDRIHYTELVLENHDCIKFLIDCTANLGVD